MAATRPLRPLARLFMPSSHLPSSSHFPSFSSSGRRHSTTGSTVDASELQHFAQLASSWWDPHGSSRLLHLMNPLRLRFLQSCLLRSPPYSSTASARLERGADPIATVTGKDNARRMRYLDVGCGGGILAESLARLPSTADVLAVDPSPEVLAVARAHARRDPVLRGRLRYENTTVDALGAQHGVEAPGQFDVVTTMEVVEHVPDRDAFLTACMAHVRPGGWLALSTIARTWASFLTTKLVAEDLLGIVPRGTHDWNKYVNADELREFFARQNGWGDVTVMGAVYIPGLGWREVRGGEKVGNYFLGVRRLPEE